MTTKPIRLIATDLDGTLLRNDGKVSDRTIAAIRRALDAGIEVVPATGRPRMVAEDVLAQIGFLDHWIFANGSVTWHHGRAELVRGFWLSADASKDLIARIRSEMPGAGFAVEFEDDVAYERGFEQVVPQIPPAPPSVDLLDRIDRRVQKVLVFDTSRTIDDLFATVSAAVGSDAVVTYSGLSFVELAASLVTKATALELLAADLGVGQDEVAAFGDNHNDVAMLAWAGRSYAMLSATEDAIAAAGERIGTNDADSVAAKIDELVAEHG